MKRIVATVLIVGMLLCLCTPYVYAQSYEGLLLPMTLPPLRGQLMEKIAERRQGPWEDYYDYVNREWLAEMELPYGQTAWSDLNALVLSRMQEIGGIVYSIHRRRTKGQETFPKGSREQKIADVFLAGSNTALRDSLGLAPAEEYLSMIADAETMEELLSVMAQLEYHGFHGLFPLSVTADMKDSSRYILTFSECYTGMNVSLVQGPDADRIGNAYQNYLTGLFSLFGFSEPERRAEAVTELCRSLAEASMPFGEHNQIARHYTLCDAQEREKLFLNLDTESYLKTLGFPAKAELLIYDMSLAKAADRLWKKENLSLLKDYLRASVMDGAAVYLNTDAFLVWRGYQDALNGVESGVLPADYAVSMVEELLGWELAGLYVSAYADAEEKQEVTAITRTILDAYRKRISSNTWLSQASRKASLKKLDSLRIRVGYPEDIDAYPDAGYEILPVREGGNLLRYRTGYCNRYFDLAISRIREKTPVDKDAWSIYPQTVNALYEPSSNSITIPLGLLDAPFYSKAYSFESKLGRVGAVIAHEISHALDALGSQFDENGNLIDWWQKTDKQAFEEICNRVIAAYDGVEVAGDLTVDGRRTLSENLADLAGMACILDIAGEDNPRLDELFSGYAETWRTKTTEGYLKRQVMTDTHAPDKVRVNRVLSNFAVFSRYYGIHWGDGMYLPKKEQITIW